MSADETIDATDFDLLTAVKDRLQKKVKKLEPGGLIGITDSPIPPTAYFPRGDFFCTLTFTGGNFDKRMYEGGGANQLCEQKQLVVTVFSRVNIDQPPRLEHAMLDAERGMLAAYKPQVLSAILVDDPTAEILQPWQPLNNGKAILRGSITPDRCQGPVDVNGDWLGLSLFFDVEFDWNLRTPRPEE